MPLAHTPHRPRPEVEFLDVAPISTEAAIRGLQSSLSRIAGVDEAEYEAPGSTLVNFKQLPGILETLRTDWVRWEGAARPAACFVEVHGRLEMHMHPCFLGPKLALGMRGAAGSLLLRFSERLRCVPIGFTFLEPVGTYGAVVGESPYVHFLLEFRAVGFVPKQGDCLVGKASQHQTAVGLNILVLNTFNCFVTRKRLPSAFWFNREESRWEDGDSQTPVSHTSGPVWMILTSKLQECSGHGPVSLFGILQWPAPVSGAEPAAIVDGDLPAPGKARSSARAELAALADANAADGTGGGKAHKKRRAAELAAVPVSDANIEEKSRGKRKATAELPGEPAADDAMAGRTTKRQAAPEPVPVLNGEGPKKPRPVTAAPGGAAPAPAVGAAAPGRRRAEADPRAAPAAEVPFKAPRGGRGGRGGGAKAPVTAAGTAGAVAEAKAPQGGRGRGGRGGAAAKASAAPAAASAAPAAAHARCMPSLRPTRGS